MAECVRRRSVWGRLYVHTYFFFFQAEDGIRDRNVTGAQTCALPICHIIYKSAGDVTALAKAMAHLGLPMWLGRIPAESSTIKAVTEVWRGRGIVVRRPTAGCPWIEIGRASCRERVWVGEVGGLGEGK